MDDGRRRALEQLDIRPLDRGEVAARGNGSRRLLGIEEPGDIGLGDEADEEDDGDQKRDAREAVPHGASPGSSAAVVVARQRAERKRVHHGAARGPVHQHDADGDEHERDGQAGRSAPRRGTTWPKTTPNTGAGTRAPKAAPAGSATRARTRQVGHGRDPDDLIGHDRPGERVTGTRQASPASERRHRHRDRRRPPAGRAAPSRARPLRRRVALDDQRRRSPQDPGAERHQVACEAWPTSAQPG